MSPMQKPGNNHFENGAPINGIISFTGRGFGNCDIGNIIFPIWTGFYASGYSQRQQWKWS